jgi:anti-sigma B factor antagonist
MRTASVEGFARRRHPSEFEVVRRDLGTVCILVVRGGVDIARARQLGSTINDALGTTPERLVIDLCDVEFVDPTGLAVLVNARRRTLRQGIELRLVCDVPSTLRVLAITQLDRALDVHRSREEALR